MINFDHNLQSIVSSELIVKASGSIIDEINNDLKKPEGANIDILLKNEKNIKK